jgi:NADPH:quinone reductase-like Zn-dependent oxidoreductase
MVGDTSGLSMRSDEALALWVTGPGSSELRREKLPPLGEGNLRVRALYSGVSRGTESLVFNGHVPPSEYARMRAPFQAGDFPAPVKYGYASVGRVLEGPADRVGELVFCLYPHQSQYLVPLAEAYPIPEGVPPARAVLTANLETAINAVWDAGVGPGDRVTVIGAGSVGCLVAWLAARIPGCDVELVDTNSARAEVARALGAHFAQPGSLREDVDLVVHASGSAGGLELALGIAGFESTILELSWYGDRRVTLPLGGAFHSRRLTLKSSQVGSVALPRRTRWTHARRMGLALALLGAPELDVLVNSESGFHDLPATMAELARGAGNVIMHRVVYE